MSATLVIHDRTPSQSDTVAEARTRVVLAARRDIRVGMSLAVPFVLDHPEQASVLSELGAMASTSPDDLMVYRSAVADLVRGAIHGQRS